LQLKARDSNGDTPATKVGGKLKRNTEPGAQLTITPATMELDESGIKAVDKDGIERDQFPLAGTVSRLKVQGLQYFNDDPVTSTVAQCTGEIYGTGKNVTKRFPFTLGMREGVLEGKIGDYGYPITEEDGGTYLGITLQCDDGNGNTFEGEFDRAVWVKEKTDFEVTWLKPKPGTYSAGQEIMFSASLMKGAEIVDSTVEVYLTDEDKKKLIDLEKETGKNIYSGTYTTDAGITEEQYMGFYIVGEAADKNENPARDDAYQQVEIIPGKKYRDFKVTQNEIQGSIYYADGLTFLEENIVNITLNIDGEDREITLTKHLDTENNNEPYYSADLGNLSFGTHTWAVRDNNQTVFEAITTLSEKEEDGIQLNPMDIVLPVVGVMLAFAVLALAYSKYRGVQHHKKAKKKYIASLVERREDLKDLIKETRKSFYKRQISEEKASNQIEEHEQELKRVEKKLEDIGLLHNAQETKDEPKDTEPAQPAQKTDNAVTHTLSDDSLSKPQEKENSELTPEKRKYVEEFVKKTLNMGWNRQKIINELSELNINESEINRMIDAGNVDIRKSVEDKEKQLERLKQSFD